MPTLKSSRTIERWSVLIPKANGKGNEVYKKVERIIREDNPPQVQMENKMVSPTSALKGLLLGKKREYLIVRSEFLIAHKIFIGARDYGNQLAVSWYLVLQTGFGEFMKAKKLIKAESGSYFEFEYKEFKMREHGFNAVRERIKTDDVMYEAMLAYLWEFRNDIMSFSVASDDIINEMKVMDDGCDDVADDDDNGEVIDEQPTE